MLLLSSAALVLFALTLILQLRHGIPPDQRLMDNAVPFALRLLSPLDDGDDDRIVAAVGAVYGLRELRLTIRSMGAYARRSDHPDARKVVWASWWAFALLGWPAWLAMRLRARFPNVPVICVESLSRHFCSMCATVDAIQSMLDYL